MMSDKSNHLSENVYIILHELLVPLKALVGSYSVLYDKVPKTIEESFSLFGQVSNKLHTEIMVLFREPNKKINLQSADIASEQIRLLSCEWMKDIEKLSQLVSEISKSNIHLEDDLLDKILDGVLSKKALESFSEKVSCLMQVEAKHLILDDGFFDVFRTENS